MGQHYADRFTVVLDANVLYPFWMRDALLRFHEAGLFRARWSDTIVDEWVRSLLARKPDRAESVHRQVAAMRKHFDDSWVRGHETLIDGLALPDPDDRHVLAAAIRCGAQHIVTRNLKDCSAESLAAFDVEAIDPDDFLCRTFELYPEAGIDAFRQMREDYRNPPFRPAEFLMELAAKGMPRLAARLKPDCARI